jgi:hypothetical protein
MMRKKTGIKLGTLGIFLVMSGCSTQNLYNTPIEDRSTSTKPLRESNSIVTPVDPSSGVIVTPVAPTPVFRTQRDSSSEPGVNSAPKAVVRSEQNPAALALLDTARQQTNSGRLRDAQTSLQRAQRISPKNPEVYYSLADTHRRLGEFLQAEQVALKGVAVAQGQNNYLRRLWLLIASIRTDTGDIEGANKAAVIAKRY